MTKKNPQVDAYIARSAEFARPILKHLRKIVHTACPEVEETIKWRMPSFMYKGMLCSMAAFKEHCAFGCWKHSLVKERLGGSDKSDEAMGQLGRITSLADLPSDKLLLDCLKEAVRLNEEGIKKPKPRAVKKELVVPDYLSAALKKNARALKTFDGFTYSHKKEYVEWLVEAKREETRAKRLATTIAWLSQGKPRNWKYANC
ncbi:MAG: hypothetical protein C5B50_18730 [Verrucomicrobia bacterium]|nr:MAG: hypothetical protein C5B50_18730 [Verrucomicrobiota bacterium]